MTITGTAPQQFPNPDLALGGEIERLPDFAAREGLTVRMVVDLAAAVAENLSHLHGQRRAHGSIVERNILVCDGQGWLVPPDRNHAGVAVSDDIRQFRDLFRSLLWRTSDPAARTVSAEIDALLERLPAAGTPDTGHTVHSAGRQMKRVALGLKVLRARVTNPSPKLVQHPTAITVPVAPSTEEAAAITPARTTAPGRKIVMLLRVVAEGEEAPRVETGWRGFRLRGYMMMLGTAVGTGILLLLIRTLR